MTHDQIAQAFVSVIGGALADYGRNDIAILQAYQPTQQNAGVNIALYFAGVTSMDNVYKREINDYDNLKRKTVFTSRHVYQFTAVRQAKEDESETGFDVATICSQVMQVYGSIRAFKDGGINIEKITPVRHNWIESEGGGFDDFANFDMTFYTESVIEETLEPAQVRHDLYRV